MSRFVITATSLAGLKVVARQRLEDTRGFFARVFCSEELRDAGWDKPVAQANYSYSAKRGTVRGMHFQWPPYAEMKLVSCIRGEVFDVAVDIRAGSATFLQWHGVHLSAENGNALLLPEGFAHGFQTLTDDAELLYFHSAPYVAQGEAGLNPCDARLGIAWPLDITDISPRDAAQAFVADEFEGIRL